MFTEFGFVLRKQKHTQKLNPMINGILNPKQIAIDAFYICALPSIKNERKINYIALPQIEMLIEENPIE